jgi:hypothetical protein
VTAKRLELLHELVPGTARVAVLVNPTNPATEATLEGAELAARGTGLQLQVFNASSIMISQRTKAACSLVFGGGSFFALPTADRVVPSIFVFRHSLRLSMFGFAHGLTIAASWLAEPRFALAKYRRSRQNPAPSCVSPTPQLKREWSPWSSYAARFPLERVSPYACDFGAMWLQIRTSVRVTDRRAMNDATKVRETNLTWKWTSECLPQSIPSWCP